MHNQIKKCESDEKESSHIVDTDDKDIVQSRAVTRQAEAAPLVPYQRLELNTNLNLPPSNWLYGRNSFRFINTVPSNSSEYSSFRIALENIDLIGDVDVVSWAQNVKTLLKIPYNPNAQVSLMLHKVGNTLLIDEFDLNLILRNSNVHWEWFKKFFSENVYNSFKEHQKGMRPNKSRSVIINRNLFSKFLYYSLGEGDGQTGSNTHPLLNEKEFSVTQPLTKREQIEPSITSTLPAGEEPSFDRHVIWNFEDIKMLIGTDLPIFEGKDNLCISLRLNEISKPINVLTGLDYWLDDLMCNVPEIAMCYHFQGLVKEYDFLKTEDLPNLPDSKFSPKEVLDVAQNILSFLKSKATKEGHTYWLFKAKDDLYVKLYDLTSLSDEPEEFCINPEAKSTSQTHSPNSKNPFTFPVAMLCYKVAERMSSYNCSSLHAQICSLLKNTLKLLSAEHYPQICCAANCILSDAYLPKELDPQSPHLSDVSDDEETVPRPMATAKRKKGESKKFGINKNKENTVEMMPLEFLSHPYDKTDLSMEDFTSPPPLGRDLIVRCAQARRCILNAFKCIDEKNANEEFEKQQNINPNDPIPMPYEPLNKPSDNANEKQESQKETDQKLPQKDCGVTISVFGSDCTVFSWLEKVTVLLLQKIYLLCLVEAKLASRKNSYGPALKYIKLALQSVKCIEATLRDPKLKFNHPFDAYVLAGGVYYDLAVDFGNIEHHVNEFALMDETYLEIKQRLDCIYDGDVEIIREMPTELGESLHSSEKCFSSVMGTEKNRVTLEMRVQWGLACHGLGTIYMDKSKDICNKYNKKMEETGVLYENAEKYFQQCSKCYADTKNNRQLAWTKLNIGHFYRLCAFYHSDIDNFTTFYIKATLEYKRALRGLGVREPNSSIWDKINLELVKTLKSYGIAIYSLFEAGKMEKSVQEKSLKQLESLFNEAVAICNTDIYKNNFSIESLEIHTIWAKLYYLRRQNRSDKDATKFQKKAEEHYDVVLKYYERMSMPYECLKVTLDRMSLIEGVETMGKTVWNTSVTELKVLAYKCLPLLYKCKSLSEDAVQSGAKTKSSLTEIETEALTKYHQRLATSLKYMKSSIGQYRKKKINKHLMEKLCKQCTTTPVEVGSLISFIEIIKSELLAVL